MADIRSPRISSSPLGPFRCSICRTHGFSLDTSQDLPELQSDPRDPVFISHTARLLSSVDLDSLHGEADRRDAASQAHAILALQVVLSSVLRSPSFSPAERAAILQETRLSLAEQHHVSVRLLDYVLSEPFRSLDGLTPLEFEIQRWSPIWETEIGKRTCMTGMETIHFLIEHWRPHLHVINQNSVNHNDESDQEMFDPRHQLVGLVRNACMRKLWSISSEYSELNEDNINVLLRRIAQLIWSHGADEENTVPGIRRHPEVIGALDYKASLAYSPIHAEPDKKGKAAPTSPSTFPHDVDFTVLISIANFIEQFRNFSAQERPSSTESRNPEETISRIRQRISSIRRHQGRSLHHPYARHPLKNQSEASETVQNRAGSEPPSQKFARWAPTMPPRHLLVEFVAAAQAWTLAIGHNELELSVLTQETLTKAESVPETCISPSPNSSEFSAALAHAEVRVVPPQLEQYSFEGNERYFSAEHVFTFPPIHIVSSNTGNKNVCHGGVNSVRVFPCFFPVGSVIPTQTVGPNPPVSRFDDARILHGGEMLLELRVRIRRPSCSGLDKCHLDAPSPPDCYDMEPSNDGSKNDSSSWSDISIPPKDGSTLGVVSLKSSDFVSNPPSTSSVESELSWTRL